MVQSILKVCEVLAVIATFCGFGYTLVSMWSAVRFLWKPDVLPPVSLPPVSILKPLKGLDPAMLDSLRSHCRQELPDYEIVFGVSDANDPAIAAVHKLQHEFPTRGIKLVVAEKKLGANTKVSTLAQMLPHASHPCLVVNDSDIQVRPDYLRRVVSPLANPRVGLVTCLYRGIPGPTMGSWAEALGIVDFASGVLAARQLEGGIHFGLGSTLAFRRQDLEAIGGFEAFADYLADDYQLGVRLTNQGFIVELSHLVVETFLPAYPLNGFVSHQLRWARTVRDSRRWGYAGLAFTHYLPWAVVALLLAEGALWAWFLLGAALSVRMTSILAVGHGVLNDRRTLRYVPLIPLRDTLAFAIWIFGFFGHAVKWRGESFYLKDGKLVRIYP
jgi:ceramide glucosyltransferase